MSPSTSLPLPSARLNGQFTVQGDTLLYADIPRVPINELQKLLSRGSGKIVRSGERTKTWFQAQCAHYGLPTDGTLATLRLYLENSLKSFQERMREKADRLEKERLEMEKKSRQSTANIPEKSPINTVRFPAAREQLSQSTSSSSSSDSFAAPRIRFKSSLPKAINCTMPPRASLPVLAPAVKPSRRRSEPKGLKQVKLDTKFPDTSSSSADTESEGDNSCSVVEPPTTFPPPGLASPLFHPNPSRYGRNKTRELEKDVVSGRWALHVTCSTMEPLPAPWRAASSKWLRGDMDVHLSDNRRSITAQFALLGWMV
ncbi:hypothetical protein RhiJN_22755 [Ceratobasidium sp. AG-Ba]|nr:hypothetical protein RhiJN_22755 [Ceratobasidium sp. AG-Ba]